MLALRFLRLETTTRRWKDSNELISRILIRMRGLTISCRRHRCVVDNNSAYNSWC